MKLETFFENFDRFADAPDAVARMRELVLRLAVQGRLSDAAESDEPVTEFLERIWSDKTDPRIEIIDVEKAQPFELPPHWRWVVLADVVDFSIGKTPPRGDSRYWSPEKYSWVTISDMNHYQTITETKEKVSSLAAKDVFRQRYTEPGSILMSFKLTIGKIARAGIPCFHNEAIISFNPPESELSEYLFRFLPIFAALQTSKNAIKGRTLNKGLLTLLPIALPPIAEQKRLVAKVDELMALCDHLDAQQKERETRHPALARASLARFADAPTPANLQFLFHKSYSITPADLRKSILTLAVQGKLVPQDPNDEPAAKFLEPLSMRLRKANVRSSYTGDTQTDDSPKSLELPSGWAWAHFPELGEFGRGKSKHRPRNDRKLFVNGKHRLIQTGDVARANGIIETHTGLYNDMGLAQSKMWPAGTLCITIAANIADSGILAFDACFPDSIVGFIPAAPIPSARYFEYFMRTAKEHLEQYAPATAQKNINLGILEQLWIPVPPLAEQRRIVAKVNELMGWVDQLEIQQADSRAVAEKLMEAIVGDLTTTA